LESPNPSSQRRSRDPDVRVSSPPHHVSDSVPPAGGRHEALMLTKDFSLPEPPSTSNEPATATNRPSTSYNAREFCLTARRETPAGRKAPIYATPFRNRATGPRPTVAFRPRQRGPLFSNSPRSDDQLFPTEAKCAEREKNKRIERRLSKKLAVVLNRVGKPWLEWL
jgi:hypothetical protein